MFIPIGDENPRERTPYVNNVLLALNIAVFVLFCFPEPREQTVLARFALKPAEFGWPQVFTSMFLHAGAMHLIGNMLFLWIFGDNVEDRFGHIGYAALYAACGTAAALAHVSTTSRPDLYTLGASGAVSGAVGAYVVFFPRHRVKMLLWFYLFIDVVRIPAVWWIGFWFLQQVFFASLDIGNVAYMAHIGGFAVGGIAAAGVKLISPLLQRRSGPVAVHEAFRPSSRRTPFLTVEDDADFDIVKDLGDRYAVLRLTDDAGAQGQIVRTTAHITREDPRQIARRLEATRGMIAKDVPRADAERIQRDLHVYGLETALILYHPANFPPERPVVRSASWDADSLRLSVGTDGIAFRWPAPFLYLAARVGGVALIDIFLDRRKAYRISEETALTAVDTRLRRERPAGLGDLSRAILHLQSGAAVNEGIQVLARRGAWGWLSFRNFADYDDYVFWTYNVILSRIPLHRK